MRSLLLWAGESKEHTSSSEKSGGPSSSGSGAADPSAPLTPERRSSPEPAPDSARKPPPTPSPPARALQLPAHALAAGAQQEAGHEPSVDAGPSPQTVPAPVPGAQRDAALAGGSTLMPSAQGSEAQAQAGATAGALDSGGSPHMAPSAPQLEVPIVFQHYLAERGAVAVEAAQVQASLQEAVSGDTGWVPLLR